LRFVPQAFVGLRQFLRTDFKAAVAQRQIALVLAVRVVHLSQQLGQTRQYRLKVGRHIGSLSQIPQQTPTAMPAPRATEHRSCATTGAAKAELAS
jgi:hypothetical protein